MNKLVLGVLALCVSASLWNCSREPSAPWPPELNGWWVREDYKLAEEGSTIGYSFYSDGRAYFLTWKSGPGTVEEGKERPLPLTFKKGQICWIAKDEEGGTPPELYFTGLKIGADGKSIHIAKGLEYWNGKGLLIGRLVKFEHNK